ncbi:uncharacterized protein LOC112457690 [Temnothorax curvispinosus]|uniref:Uncharacterized protein LOC112457690 n=1 Tax=Temnothorax curvispinosus TaxID=300111 RepID=A0A6J1Q398_9HYME|nr:uncharacterized protein LOC112457690 [Temnothorax curvispinosus]
MNEIPASTSKGEQNAVTTSNLTSTQEERSNKGVVSSNNFSNTTVNTTLMPTASVLLKNKSRRSVRIRALLDQGSQASFVTESVVQLLGAERKRVSIQVSGIGGSKAGSSKSIASFTVEPCSQGGPVLPFKAFVLPKVTNYLPQLTMMDEMCRYLSSLDLADSELSNQQGIDLLIGTDYYGAVLRDGLIHGPSGGPIAQLTIFGWVVSGPIQNTSQTLNNYRINVNHGVALDSLDESLRSFWELEEVPCGNLLSEEDIRCEAHFANTHSRLPDGRCVRLPFKTGPPIPIGDTEQVAKRIFISNEVRVSRQLDLAKAYRDFMREYEDLNHMKKAPSSETTRQRVYFPHHATIKETSQTTKVRVVFNASKCSSNTTSLNDFLMVGPKLQANLFAVILRWRSHRYVYTTDIEKMFHQIRVHPEDVEYQCIFRRAHPNAELIAYWLLTVTYGTGPAPFLANRSVKQLAKDEGEKFPLAIPILEEETYVDDIMFGAKDLILLKQTRDQLIQLLKAGGFRPYKWASNDPRLLQDIPEADHGLAVDKHLGDDSSLRVLGIVWNPNTDSFQVHTHLTTDLQFTKRSFLSLLSRVFDPLHCTTTPRVLTR